MHTIRLIATDGDAASDTATVTVTITSPANQPPTASITSPADGSSFTAGTNVSFRGTGVDPEDGLLSGVQLVWTSDIQPGGPFGAGSPTNENGLIVGTHLITLTVTDTDGATGTDQISVTITSPANQAPTASITAPSQDTTATQGDPVAFAGTGSDPEDGSLIGTSLQWQSSLDGGIGSGVSFSKSNLTVGVHTIRLIATDGDAASDTATVTVIIVAPANQAPTASITAPSQDTTATQGDPVAFAGTGIRPGRRVADGRVAAVAVEPGRGHWERGVVLEVESHGGRAHDPPDRYGRGRGVRYGDGDGDDRDASEPGADRIDHGAVAGHDGDAGRRGDVRGHGVRSGGRIADWRVAAVAVEPGRGHWERGVVLEVGSHGRACTRSA